MKFIAYLLSIAALCGGVFMLDRFGWVAFAVYWGGAVCIGLEQILRRHIK